MPVPSSITELSTTPASNFPGGGETAGLVDDYLRQFASFIALIRDGDYKRPLYSKVISAPPATLGNHDAIATAFSGDVSKVSVSISHQITGTTTLGNPTTGYLYTPEAYPDYLYMVNSSGWNQSTSSNVGRTGAAARRTKVDQYGQGDAVAYNFSVTVSGTRIGSTNFLANPAGSGVNGDINAQANGVYLNPYEVVCRDNFNDVACIGLVNNFYRTNATGAKSAFWGGARFQSLGTEAMDNLISATGKFSAGIDFSMSVLDFGANQAAISLKSGQRIYFNNNALASGNLDADWRTTGFNGDYITHAGSFLNFVQGGTSRLQVGAAVLVNTGFQISIGSVVNYANDAAAASGGLPIGGIYRNGSALQIRVT